MKNVQEEIRKLHFQLKKKDIAILKMKKAIQELKARDEDSFADIDLADIEGEESKAEDNVADIDTNENKDQERQIIKLLTSEIPIDPKTIDSVTFSTLMEPADVKIIIQNHNNFLH